MPDTPGKRQRREVKAKKRQAREGLRDDRKARKNDPTAGPNEWLADEDYISRTAWLPPATYPIRRPSRPVAEAAFRSRPPSPTARESSSVMASSSARAAAMRSGSFHSSASLRSSVSSSTRRLYADFAAGSRTSPASPSPDLTERSASSGRVPRAERSL